MRKKRPVDRPVASDPAMPKYSIAVASDLSGISQQQLRRMEDEGLVAPERTAGKTRRYSDHDLSQIAEATELAEQGINAAGIRYVLELRAQVETLQRENELQRRQIAELLGKAPGRVRGQRRQA